jgi:hypothetical protein
MMEHKKESLTTDFRNDLMLLIGKYNNEFNKDYKCDKFMSEVFIGGLSKLLSYLIATGSSSKEGTLDKANAAILLGEILHFIGQGVIPCFEEIKEAKDKHMMEINNDKNNDNFKKK